MQEYSIMKLLEHFDFAKDVTTRRSVFSLINKYNGVFFIRKLKQNEVANCTNRTEFQVYLSGSSERHNPEI